MYRPNNSDVKQLEFLNKDMYKSMFVSVETAINTWCIEESKGGS